jgi:hypothetical protein
MGGGLVYLLALGDELDGAGIVQRFHRLHEGLHGVERGDAASPSVPRETMIL